MSGLGSIFDITLSALRTQQRNLERLQEQASSGQRILRPSDDPGDSYQIMDLQARSQSLTAYGKNIDQVTLDLSQSSGILQEVSTQLTRVRQLMTQAASGTYGIDNRRPIGQEINSILEDMVSLANTQNLGRRLFGGSIASGQAYTAQRSNGQISAVQYTGSSQDLAVPVAPGVEYSGVKVGDRVFASHARQTPTFLGQTGARAGTATSTVQGDVWLTVLHGSTTYAGATGVAAGASSATGDTVAGDSHVLTIDADSHTVRLDSGAAVAFTSASTDVMLTNDAGDTVYVDLSALDGSLTGVTEVAVHATSRLSIDDGVTTTVSDGTANQAVTDPGTGQVLYVDTSAMVRTGLEPVRVAGTYDMFDTLIQVRDLLLNTKDLSVAEQGRLLSQAVASVDEVASNVIENVTAMGGQVSALEDLQSSLDTFKSSADDQVSGLRDADVAELSLRLSRTQTLYQMTLASTAKFLSLSLLDYIRS